MQITDYTRQIKAKLGLERKLDAASHRTIIVLAAKSDVQKCPIKLDDGTIVDLYIDVSNLYLHGYAGNGKVFVTEDHPYPDVTGEHLGYASNYGSLGWQRNNTPEREFKQDAIKSALITASLGKKLKENEFINIVILMEVTRFPSLAKKISEGGAITNTDLDWAAQYAAKNTDIITHQMSQTVA